MEFFLADPDIKRLPPVETRILELKADPYPDGKRIRVTLGLTPFQQKPNLELDLFDSSGQLASTSSIVETMAWKIELTLHIRGTVVDLPKETQGNRSFTLTTTLSYPNLGEVDKHSIDIVIPAISE